MVQQVKRTRGGHVFELDDLVDGYVDVVDAIIEDGHRASPVTWRDGKPTRAGTTELLAATLIIPGRAQMLPIGTNRKVNTRLAALEAIQVVGGYSDYAALVDLMPALAAHGDDGAFYGAYGPRLRPQIATVVARLRRDLETRRAVVTLWDPLRDSVHGVRNYPCATELQFMGREGALDLHVTMRANDAWHGLAYDCFVFNQLQWTIARTVGVGVGTYYHHATSLHLYDEHLDAANGLEYPDAPPSELAAVVPYGFETVERARYISAMPAHYDAGDTSEAWYAERLQFPRVARESTPRPRGEKEMHP